MINVGVIGSGYWGPNLIRNFYEVPDVNVAACCDINTKRLKYIGQRYPSLNLYSDTDQIIRDKSIDAVSIATPISTHFPIAKKALLNDKHVLVEKPITETNREARELYDLASEKKKVLMVGHTFEYTGAVNKIKDIVNSNGIGKLFYFEASRVNLGLFQEDINVVWDLAPHDISIMLYILRSLPLNVSATGHSCIREGKEDVAYITLAFPENVIAHVHVSWLAPVKFRRIVIGGSEKMIVYDDVENIEKVKIFDKGVTISGPTRGTYERQLIYRTGDVVSPKIDTTEPLKVECEHFVNCIKEGTVPRSDGISGYRVVKVLETIQESIRAGGKSLEIKFDL